MREGSRRRQLFFDHGAHRANQKRARAVGRTAIQRRHGRILLSIILYPFTVHSLRTRLKRRSACQEPIRLASKMVRGSHEMALPIKEVLPGKFLYQCEFWLLLANDA